ncbi:MAG: pectate lyase [Rhodocyclaceae bacterium]
MKMRHALVGTLALAFAASAWAANRPKGWVTICTEGQTCSVAANTNVAFGRADQFIYKVLSGSFACAEATFGGKIAGGKNECSTAGTSASSSSVASSSSSSKSSSLTAPSSSSSSKSSSSSSSTAPSSSSSSKSSSSVASSSNSSGIPPATGTTINSTTVTIPANTTKDYGFMRIGITPQASDCDAEGQKAVFVLEDGASLKNVIIAGGLNGSDGVHCKGNCTLENVHWEDVCEDAATMEGGSGKVMKIIGGSASHASDKIFQHNGKGSTIQISNFSTYGDVQRFWASCGNCSSNGGPRNLVATGVTINGKVVKPDGSAGYLLRLNSNYGDKATLRSWKIKGWTKGNPKVCVQAIGVQPGEAQTNQGEFWNTAYCDVKESDITSF